jgi:hypothetical protein
MEQWSPKPLRSLYNLPTEPETVIIKSNTPIEKQRTKDGTPHSFNRPGLRPADPSLVIKGSLAEKLPEAPTPTKADPPVYDEQKMADIVKSYLKF